MSEEAAQKKQYGYKENSNLVIQTKAKDRGNRDEATGEAESLWGKLKGSMGDRAIQRQRDKDLEEKLGKMKKRTNEVLKEGIDQTEMKFQSKKSKSEKKTVLNVLPESGLYRPKTRETKVAFENILAFVNTAIGDEPADVIRGIAEEVLGILKSKSMKAPDKKKEIEKLLNRMNETKFSDLTQLANQIVDYDEKETVEEEKKRRNNIR